MNRKKRIKTVLTLAVILMAITAVSANAAIVIENTKTLATGGTRDLFTAFDVTGANKLVVTVAGERGTPGVPHNIDGVTYAGEPMTLVAKMVNVAYNQGGIAIYYLDNPTDIAAAGDIVVSWGGTNSTHAAAYALSGAVPGVDSVSSSVGSSTAIAAHKSDSLVIAGLQCNNKKTGVLALAPLTQDLLSAQRYSTGIFGHQFVDSPSIATPAFSGADNDNPSTIAAAFAPVVSDTTVPTVGPSGDVISWSGASYTMDPNVIDNTGSPETLTLSWYAEPNGIGDPDLDIVIDDTDKSAPIVTITKTPTGSLTPVMIVLAANNEDSGKPDVLYGTVIDVYDTACLAALAADPELEYDVADITQDCITNLEDFAQLASIWMNDLTYETAQPRP